MSLVRVVGKESQMLVVTGYIRTTKDSQKTRRTTLTNFNSIHEAAHRRFKFKMKYTTFSIDRTTLIMGRLKKKIRIKKISNF